ncbi:MAG: hypothetical protein FWH27_15690 [Planctomycetaceae bacterium]|nr:hypothetical protein [Planctomycetaceae bacterium]
MQSIRVAIASTDPHGKVSPGTTVSGAAAWIMPGFYSPNGNCRAQITFSAKSVAEKLST